MAKSLSLFLQYVHKIYELKSKIQRINEQNFRQASVYFIDCFMASNQFCVDSYRSCLIFFKENEIAVVILA